MHSRVAALDPGIFKAYDIRGLYGSQIDGDLAELIGRSFARVLARLAEKPAASKAASTRAKSPGSAITSKTSSSVEMSSAPASTATISCSSE